MSLPISERLEALKEGLRNLGDEARDIAEPLVLAAINSSGPIKPSFWNWPEMNSILRISCALLVGWFVGRFIGGAVSVQGKVMGLTLQGAGGGGAFLIVFLLYPPSLVPWFRRNKRG